MRQSRSFKEYVKNNFDNQMWKAIEVFLENEDLSVLGLHLNKVREIGEIELYDTELLFVDISDLPGTRISFDVVMDATLIVHDADRYHNDESDATHQWFLIRCSGDLELRLQDLTISSTEVYNSRNRQSRPMSDSLVPIISKDNLEYEAENFLRRNYIEALLQPMWVDPDELARRMSLTIKRQRITEDLSVFGQIYFSECDATFYDEDSKSTFQETVQPRTIVVDPEVAFQRNLGAFNNTIVHECVHWDIHKKAFALEQLFNADASQIKCKVVGGIVGLDKEATKWMEWQANALAPRIQMPLGPFMRKASEYIRKYSDLLGVFELCELMPFVIEELATFYMVSRTAAKIRMIDAGYEEAMGAFIYIDGQYVRPHGFKKGILEKNQTFSISAVDAAIQSFSNPELKLLTRDGSYQYVESHFVLNHPKYLTHNILGETVLTDYARTHMDECCLVFELSVKSGCRERYYSECFLNRDASSNIDFDIVYCNGYEHSSQENKSKVLADKLLEEAEIYNNLPNSYTRSLEIVFDWRGVTYKELGEKINIDAKTIGRIVNGETKGSINSIVLICLGLNLPPLISGHIIKNCPHSLNMSDMNHQWYNFALTYKYTKSIKEIRAFLLQQGAELL